MAILSVLSGQGSLVGMERFAKRHRHTLNELLGPDVGKLPPDSTFRLLLAQLDTLVCEGKTLRVPSPKPTLAQQPSSLR